LEISFFFLRNHLHLPFQRFFLSLIPFFRSRLKEFDLHTLKIAFFLSRTSIRMGVATSLNSRSLRPTRNTTARLPLVLRRDRVSVHSAVRPPRPYGGVFSSMHSGGRPASRESNPPGPFSQKGAPCRLLRTRQRLTWRRRPPSRPSQDSTLPRMTITGDAPIS